MKALVRLLLVCLLVAAPALRAVPCATSEGGAGHHQHLASIEHGGHGTGAHHGKPAALPPLGWCCTAPASLDTAAPVVTRTVFASAVRYIVSEARQLGRSEAPEPGVPKIGADAA